DPLAHLGSELWAIRGSSPLSQLLAANFASYLPDDLLVKTDRSTMATSLEARSPLLDTSLVEYVATLPDAFKLQRGRTKGILRDAGDDPKTRLAASDPSCYDADAQPMISAIGLPFLMALTLSLVCVPLCRLVALRRGFVARPREDRWHRRPVALFGGVGIAFV